MIRISWLDAPTSSQRNLRAARACKIGRAIGTEPVQSQRRTAMYFEIYRSSNNQYYFNIKGANHEPLASSETYTAKASAQNAINVIKAGAASARVIDNT